LQHRRLQFDQAALLVDLSLMLTDRLGQLGHLGCQGIRAVRVLPTRCKP
jgi:hypothetical protein